MCRVQLRLCSDPGRGSHRDMGRGRGLCPRPLGTWTLEVRGPVWPFPGPHASRVCAGPQGPTAACLLSCVQGTRDASGSSRSWAVLVVLGRSSGWDLGGHVSMKTAPSVLSALHSRPPPARPGQSVRHSPRFTPSPCLGRIERGCVQVTCPLWGGWRRRCRGDPAGWSVLRAQLALHTALDSGHRALPGGTLLLAWVGTGGQQGVEPRQAQGDQHVPWGSARVPGAPLTQPRPPGGFALRTVIVSHPGGQEPEGQRPASEEESAPGGGGSVLC